MAYLKAEELRPGMRLKSDFINEEGTLFLAKGTTLTSNMIERIKDLNIPYLSIVTDNGVKERPSRNKTTYQIKTEQFLKVYNDSNKVIKELFDSVQSGRMLDLDGIRETVSVFIDLINDDENIVPKLQQIHITDEYTYYHSINVSLLAILMGKWLKMPAKDLRKLGYTGVFHDIGKCRIPLEILNKPDNLDEKEWNIMKQHPIYGYSILKKNKILSNDVLMSVLVHHERKDGSGYPLGLKEEKIHTYGKIVAVADIFDAMMSDRVYRKKRPPFQVAEYISDRSFDSLDPYISRIFLEGISRFFVGNIVRLSDGRIGKIVYIHPQQHTKPVVLAGGEFLDFSKKMEITIVEIIG